MADNWIQSVDKEMEKKGTKGAFTKQAKKEGMSVHDFAMKVKNNPSDYSETTRKRGQFALNMEKIAKKNKMAKGGKTQKFNDKLNEDLGERLGRESNYEQSLKDRRDESKAGNKSLGRRAYSSVSTMDKNNRMMLMEGGKMKYMEGGKTQGYDDRDRESIGERNRGKKSQSLKSRMKESAGMEKSMGRRKYADVSTMDKGDKMFAKGGNIDKDIAKFKKQLISKEKSRGLYENFGQKEVSKIKDKYDSYERDDMGVQNATKIQDFSDWASGYDGTRYARGGSVKGKIDRDRYVKLRREKDKTISKLKKEKGVLRKEAKDCDKTGFLPKVSAKKDNQEVMLLSAIAGIFFGAFFSK